ncbi:MAG: hypothetical protein K0Q97_827 [Bacillota bacterium]|nr:hypothetical protein [Bacillota bacterium]
MKSGDKVDWNKSNTILIIAFVIINIFLFTTDYNTKADNELSVYEDKNFIENVKMQLNSKNIKIETDVPKETYTLPVLETEYEIIEINDELVQNYLGANIKSSKDVLVYNNNQGETLEIVDGKRIVYTIRQKISSNVDDFNDEVVNNAINEFLQNKKISKEGFINTENYIYSDYQIATYAQKYNELSLENSYMSFYVDKEGIYKFEMQKISSVMEIKAKVHTISSYEALLRLMAYDEIKNKNIIGIKMTYYSLENDNWKYITRINADPTWKVIFSDGTHILLSSFD